MMIETIFSDREYKRTMTDYEDSVSFRVMLATTVFLLNQLGKNVVPFPYDFSSFKDGIRLEVTYQLAEKGFFYQVLGCPISIFSQLLGFKRA